MWRDDAGIDAEGEEGEDHVEVEEGGDFLAAWNTEVVSLTPINPKPTSCPGISLKRPTNSSKLPPHMQQHDHRHDQRNNMHHARRALEDDGVGHLNVARIAIRLDADAQGHRCYRPN